MKLVSISADQIHLGEPLPFGLRDAAGRLLLGAGLAIDSADKLAELHGTSLFAAEAEAADWQRRLAAAMDAAIRQGAQLRQVVAARPEEPRERSSMAALTLSEQWDEAVAQLDAALRDVRPDNDWRSRLLGVHARARALAQRRPDASLYHMVYEAGQSTPKYSSHHAMMAMLMAEQTATALGLPHGQIDSLGLAALTMNVSMMRLQDQLAATQRTLTPEARATIDGHAEAGARLLKEGGLSDPLCLEIVRQHHDTSDGERPLAELPPPRLLARLLCRVDGFAAKISRRASRPPMSPVQAAREACLGADGKPDEIGGALLRAVGLYPPGSFVELANGEMGIVLARGRRANLPFVATLVSASGNPLGEPALRDTLDRRYAVKSALPPGAVKVRPPHERLLAMR